MAHGLDPFLTDHLNYPFGVNLTWNAAMPLPSLLSAPLQGWLGPIAAYNLVLVSGIGLSGWTAYLAARRFCRGRLGPMACGVLYGFSPYMLPQAQQHLQLVLMIVPPLVLVVVDEMTRRQRWSPYWAGVALGVLAAAQLLIEEEVLASMALVGVVGLAIVVAQGRERVRNAAPYFLRALAVSLPVFAALGAWPLATQFLGPQRLHGEVQARDVFVTDLLNLIVPTDRQLIFPHQAAAITSQFSGLGIEQNGYLGLPLLSLLVFLGLRRWRDPTTRTFALMAGVTTVLSMGPHLHVAGQVTAVPLPWMPIGMLPLLGNILPGRLMLYTFLFAGLVIAQWPDAQIGPTGRRWLTPAGGIVLLVLVPLLPAWPFPLWQGLNPVFFSAGAPSFADESVVLVAPFIRDGGNADPMLWAAETGDRVKMPQGYFFIPGIDGRPYYGALRSPLVTMMEDVQERPGLTDYEGAARQAIASDVRQRRVDTIVVGPMRNRDAMVQAFALLLRRPPDERVGGVVTWRNVAARGIPTGPPT